MVTATAMLAIATITFVVFLPAIEGEFLNWDDDRNFVENEAFRGLRPDNLSWAWQTYHLGVWQPLAWVLFAIQHAVGGWDPRVYHTFSVALHALNAAVFLLLTMKLIGCTSNAPVEAADPAIPSRRYRAVAMGAMIAALLFALNPLRVEAVAWVSCQPYLPAALFFMLAMIAYLHGFQGASGTRSRTTYSVVAFVLYIIAVLFKAVAITLPLVLLIADVYPLRRLCLARPFDFKRCAWLLVEKIPFFIVAAIAAKWAIEAKDFNESHVALSRGDLLERLGQSADGVIFYLSKTGFPRGLTAYHELPESLLTFWPSGAAMLAVAAITIIAVRFRRRCPALLAGWGAYLVILAPNLGLIQISQQIVAERYGYLAMLPLFALLGGAIAQQSCARKKAVGVARRIGLPVTAGLLVIVSSILTCLYLSDWRDSVSLWRASVAVNPQCEHSHCQLGAALAAEAQSADALARWALLTEAAQHLRQAVSLRNDFAFAISNLGAVLLKSEDFDGARGAYESALQHADQFTDKELARIHAGLALASANLGDQPAARAHLRTAQKLGLPPEQVLRVMDIILGE
ncbi:MAG TPA: tetratricopeptide repeat protein [Phycisphaerae bacterium]|nr:tetratricopeptide repeat protein [Phycisphaerae bacterium]